MTTSNPTMNFAHLIATEKHIPASETTSTETYLREQFAIISNNIANNVAPKINFAYLIATEEHIPETTIIETYLRELLVIAYNSVEVKFPSSQ